MKKILNLLKTFPLVMGLVGCAAQPYVAHRYAQVVENTQATTRRTVVVFLVDGLPASSVKELLGQDRLPNIKNYFLKNKVSFQLARTPFPSLTFPGIGSLLTERPVHQHGLYGNNILKQGRNLSFEDPQQYDELRKMIRGKTIFERLREKGLKSVAINYNFNKASDAQMELYDLEVALAVQEKNYSYVDNKLLGSLKALLKDTPVVKWPDFIFVHLVGLDFTSHDQGPKSKAALDYLAFLDRELGGVFKILESVEQSKKRHVVSLMTADHGYDVQSIEYLQLESFLKKSDYRIKILNEGRYAGLYLPRDWSTQRRSKFIEDLVQHPKIEIVAHAEHEQILIKSKSETAQVRYSKNHCKYGAFSISVSALEKGRFYDGSPICPEQLGGRYNKMFYPYLVSNLSYYFKTPGRPDALVIANPGVALKSTYKGLHGGPTLNESFVPLMIRNATLGNSHEAPPLWKLLNFL